MTSKAGGKRKLPVYTWKIVPGVKLLPERYKLRTTAEEKHIEELKGR